MKSWLSGGMLAVAVALPALSGAAWAGGGDDYGCSNATLNGEYAFGGTNYTNYTSLQVFTGIKVFDGNGNLTQRDYLGDTTPPEFASPGQETGTYTVNSDCTGSMMITTPSLVANILFVISDGGRHIHEVVSQLTPQGSPGPVPTQTSADDWKVASEQDQQQ